MSQPVSQIQFKTSKDDIISVSCPVGMDVTEVSESLAKYVEVQKKEQETLMRFDGIYYEDALIAVYKTAREMYPLMSTDPERQTTLQTVTLADGDKINVPVSCPLVLQLRDPHTKKSWPIKIRMAMASAGEDSAPICVIAIFHQGFAQAAVEHFQQVVLDNIRNRVYSKIARHSWEASFSYAHEGNRTQYTPAKHDPVFRSTGTFTLDGLVYSSSTAMQIQEQIIFRLRNRERLPKMGLSFNSNHLLIGGFGTGKSALINAILKEGEINGATGLIVSDPNDLLPAIEWVRQFEPAILVCEDVDRVMDGYERTVAQDRLTNLLDGINSKARNVMIIFTANNPETIQGVFVRPGRMTSIIEMKALNGDEAFRLFEISWNNFLPLDTTTNTTNMTIDGQDLLTFTKSKLAGLSPSTITELSNRCKIRAETTMATKLYMTDILYALKSMDTQLELTSRKPTPVDLENVAAAKIIGAALRRGATESVLRNAPQS